MDDLHRRQRLAHRLAERIAAWIADRPEAEGERVLGHSVSSRVVTILSEGRRPSDSPSPSLARRYAGSLRSGGSLRSLASPFLRYVVWCVSQLRYAAAACQTDFVNPLDRAAMRVNTDRMLAMVDAAV